MYFWIHQTSNITSYTLIISYLINNESIEKHDTAKFLLSMPLCAYKDAYSLGLYHTKRILELDPEDINAKISLIFFNDIPERLVKKEEAIKIAQEVLMQDPNCEVSKSVLKKYGIMKES